MKKLFKATCLLWGSLVFHGCSNDSADSEGKSGLNTFWLFNSQITNVWNASGFDHLVSAFKKLTILDLPSRLKAIMDGSNAFYEFTVGPFANALKDAQSFSETWNKMPISTLVRPSNEGIGYRQEDLAGLTSLGLLEKVVSGSQAHIYLYSGSNKAPTCLGRINSTNVVQRGLNNVARRGLFPLDRFYYQDCAGKTILELHKVLDVSMQQREGNMDWDRANPSGWKPNIAYQIFTVNGSSKTPVGFAKIFFQNRGQTSITGLQPLTQIQLEKDLGQGAESTVTDPDSNMVLVSTRGDYGSWSVRNHSRQDTDHAKLAYLLLGHAQMY